MKKTKRSTKKSQPKLRKNKSETLASNTLLSHFVNTVPWWTEISSGAKFQIGYRLNPGVLHFKNLGPKTVTLIPGEYNEPILIEPGRALATYVRNNVHVENSNESSVNIEFQYQPVFLKHY